MTALIDALEAREGIVCAVGAGGKKSVLYQLAREHPGRFALTATVHTTEFPDELGLQCIIDADAGLRQRLRALERDITEQGGKKAVAAYGPVLALMVPTALAFLLYPTLVGLQGLAGTQ